MREMRYPKVQKYCLMSVGGCYTDFHIGKPGSSGSGHSPYILDFGGTSVWYHIIRGRKIFWLIPPTETNLKIYEQWTLSGKQSNVFFGDLVEKCGKVELEAGNTFFIPSGWIHAVYTPCDSLVFGGNFLHSFAIEKQIRIAQIEELTKVPMKFRFPFFTELQWYALDKYVYHLLGRSHMTLEEEATTRLFGSKAERDAHEDALANNPPKHITAVELFGLKSIVMYIHALAVSKKAVPSLIPEPINLVRDVRVVVDTHKTDDADLAVTGKPLLYWPGIRDDPGYMRMAGSHKPKKFTPPAKRASNGRADRVACKICQACISPDCGLCANCADMVRFGGPGRLRGRPCQMRQCLQPLLAPATVCAVCGLDGWYAEVHLRLVDRPPGSCSLMECCICYEVTHPTCLTDYGVDGYVKMELPNSWECPKCVKAGRAVKLEPPNFTPSGLPTKPLANVAQGGAPPSKAPRLDDANVKPDKTPMAYGPDSTSTGPPLFSVRGMSDQPKAELRQALATQILTASTHTHKEPRFVFRPPPLQLSAEDIYERRRAGEQVDLAKERGILLKVFAKLNSLDLGACVLVCKAWNKICQDPQLWSGVKLSHKKITPHLLSLIVQRQPIK